MLVFRHPKYYEEMRKRAKEEQKKAKLKQQASSDKQQVIDETVPYNDIEEAQASSDKPQATSVKQTQDT